MGVGKTVEMDERGRITIPAEIRKAIGKNKFVVELINEKTIILRPVEDKHEIVKKILSIKLVGDKKRSSADAAYIKDFYGGIKY